jgi:hypothetical protein
MTDDPGLHNSNSPGSGGGTPPDLESLQKDYESLRLLLQTLLVGLLIFCGSVLIFVWRNACLLRRQVEQNRLVVSQVISNYDKTAPLMSDFVNQLHAFSQTNRDFAPIFNRYFGAPRPAVAGPFETPDRAPTPTNQLRK